VPLSCKGLRAAQHRNLLRVCFKRVQLLRLLASRDAWQSNQISAQSREGVVIGNYASRTGIFSPAEIALLQTTFSRICKQRTIAKGSPAAEKLAKDLVVLYQGGSMDDLDLTEAMRKARARRFSSAANQFHRNDGRPGTPAA